MQLIGGANDESICVCVPQIREVLLFPVAPLRLLCRVTDRTVRSGFDCVRYSAAEQFANGCQSREPALVFDRIMQQSSNCLIFVAASIKHKRAHGHQMTDIGDGSAFSRLRMVEPGSQLKCQIEAPVKKRDWCLHRLILSPAISVSNCPSLRSLQSSWVSSMATRYVDIRVPKDSLNHFNGNPEPIEIRAHPRGLHAIHARVADVCNTRICVLASRRFCILGDRNAAIYRRQHHRVKQVVD